MSNLSKHDSDVQHYDVVVIGAGPGGYVAAIRAAHHGAKVAVVEKDNRLGGTCLLRGCIPTKSLLHSADMLEELKGAAKYGVLANDIHLDFSGVQKAREQAVTKGAAGVDYLMKQNKIDVFIGTGTLQEAHIVSVQQASKKIALHAKHIVLATGSTPKQLPNLPANGKTVLTSDHILQLSHVPKSLLVLGSGAVGVEFASAYKSFGSDVMVVEMQDRLLPVEDADISQEFAKLFKKRGIECNTNTRLQQATAKNKQVEVTLVGSNKTWVHTTEAVLVAIGRSPVTAGLNLLGLQIKCDPGGYVEVNDALQTTLPHIYAIGDVIRTPWLAHVASAEGTFVADHLAGLKPAKINYLRVPGCTYANPEVASVGLTEQAAKERGFKLKIGKFPFSAVAKSRISGHTEGFVKIVAEAQYNEILGVHIIGNLATELIAGACIALQQEVTLEELAHTMLAHPTRIEGLSEAAHAALGRALHM